MSGESREPRRGWRGESWATLKLATPLVLIQLSYMAMFTTDVLMMGRLGAAEVAAGGLAAHYYFLFEIMGIGLLSAVAPILAQELGARRFRQVRRTVRQGSGPRSS